MKEDLRQYRLLRRIHEARGGMPKSKLRTISLCPDPEGAKYVCDQAYEGAEKFCFQADSHESVVAEMVCAIAIDRDLDTDDIAVTTEFWLPKLEDMVKIYDGHVLYVIAKRDLLSPHLADRWSWEIHWLEAMIRQQRGAANKIHHFRASGQLPGEQSSSSLKTTLVASVKDKGQNYDNSLQRIDEIEEMDLTVRPPLSDVMPKAGRPVTFWPPMVASVRRGGMQRPRNTDSEAMQRQHMTAWALNKCQEACPELPQRLHRALLREWRLVNALNNTRSKIQVRHAVSAALRRASLDHLAAQLERPMQQPQEESANETTHDQDLPAPGDSDRTPQRPPPVEQVPGSENVSQLLNTMAPNLDQLWQELMWVQSTVTHTQAFLQYQAMLPQSTDVIAQVNHLSSAQLEIAHVMESLKLTVSHLDRRISLWETNYLPAIFERMAELGPLPATDAEAEEESPQQQQVAHQRDMQEAEVQTQDAQGAVTSLAPSEPPPHHIGSTADRPTVMELLSYSNSNPPELRLLQFLIQQSTLSEGL